VAVARGNEKGRVERAIRFVRTSFFAARKWTDLDDLNRQALDWCVGLAADRQCPEDRIQTVREAFASERTKLLPIPDNPFPTDDREEVKTGKTPYVRFDLNDYSVPHDRVGRALTLFASLDQVRILDGNEVIAQHRRSYDKGEQIEDPAHVSALVEYKSRAKGHQGLDRLSRQVKNAPALLDVVARRGGNLGNVTARLLRYVDEYGATAVEQAIVEAIERQTPHSTAIRFLLERARRASGRPVPVVINLPDDPRVRDLSVRPHSLETYDTIEEVSPDEPGSHDETHSH
jgi:hypothetical protein